MNRLTPQQIDRLLAGVSDGLGVRWSADDPADLLDELTLEIGAGTIIRSALELDALGGWIFLTLRAHPMTASHLVRWCRIQKPRLLPDCIDRAIHELANAGMIECLEGRWHTKQLAAIGMRLGERAA